MLHITNKCDKLIIHIIQDLNVDKIVSSLLFPLLSLLCSSIERGLAALNTMFKTQNLSDGGMTIATSQPAVSFRFSI